MTLRLAICAAALLASVPAMADTPPPVLGSYAGAAAGAVVNGNLQVEQFNWDFRTDNSIASDAAYVTPNAQVTARAQADAWRNRAEVLGSSFGSQVGVAGILYSGMGINQKIEGAPGTANVSYSFALDGVFNPGDPLNFAPGGPQELTVYLLAYRGRVLGQQLFDLGGGQQDFRVVATNGVASTFQPETVNGNPNPNYINTLGSSIILPGGLATVCYGPRTGCVAPGAIDTTLNLDFDIAVGEDYFILTALFGRTNGTLSFFNTMELQSITLAPEFTLLSEDGGLLQRGPNGNYTLAGVPEPSSWTMLITGFGLAGAAMRRRRAAAVA